jgi:hypothetical protein
MLLGFLFMLCPAGTAVALIRRHARAVPSGPAVRDDVPERLLGWAAGLLSARRAEWGQAMLGELDHIEGRGQRWRFAAGCAGAATAGLGGAVVVRYGLGTGGWVTAAVMLIFLAGFALAASVLLRRPGIALPGLLGGLLVAVAWLAMSGFTFYGVIAPVTAPFTPLLPVIGAPLLVGAVGTLWGGSAAAGRRIARLAALSASVSLGLYGTIAVAVLGAGGPPGTPGWTVGQNVSDRLANNITGFLVALPLMTATIGWAAAAVTARLGPRLAASVAPAAGQADGVAAPRGAEPVARGRSWRRTAYLLLLCAVVAAGVLMAVVGGLRG